MSYLQMAQWACTVFTAVVIGWEFVVGPAWFTWKERRQRARARRTAGIGQAIARQETRP